MLAYHIFVAQSQLWQHESPQLPQTQPVWHGQGMADGVGAITSQTKSSQVQAAKGYSVLTDYSGCQKYAANIAGRDFGQILRYVVVASYN